MRDSGGALKPRGSGAGGSRATPRPSRPGQRRAHPHLGRGRRRRRRGGCCAPGPRPRSRRPGGHRPGQLLGVRGRLLRRSARWLRRGAAEPGPHRVRAGAPARRRRSQRRHRRDRVSWRRSSAAAPDLELVVVGGEGAQSYASVVVDGATPTPVTTDPEDLALLLFTSGHERAREGRDALPPRAAGQRRQRGGRRDPERSSRRRRPARAADVPRLLPQRHAGRGRRPGGHRRARGALRPRRDARGRPAARRHQHPWRTADVRGLEHAPGAARGVRVGPDALHRRRSDVTRGARAGGDRLRAPGLRGLRADRGRSRVSRPRWSVGRRSPDPSGDRSPGSRCASSTRRARRSRTATPARS